MTTVRSVSTDSVSTYLSLHLPVSGPYASSDPSPAHPPSSPHQFAHRPGLLQVPDRIFQFLLSRIRKHSLGQRRKLFLYLGIRERIPRITLGIIQLLGKRLSDPSKYDPQSKETADHSLPYVIAAALAERQVTPVQFEMKKIMDPVIRAQLKKVEVVADPEIEKVFPALQRVIVNLTTTDGKTFTKQLDYPKGDPRNPLSDAEVEEKFAALAEGVLSDAAQKKLKNAIWNLEKIGSVSKLMGLMKADVRAKGSKKHKGR